MKILEKYPKLVKQFEIMYVTRRNEILNEMLNNDDAYKEFCKKRKDSSILLKNAIFGTEIDELFEKYSDAAFSQDTYELDAIYKKAVDDTLSLLTENGII